MGKKLISCFLIVCLLVTMVVPTQVFATTGDPVLDGYLVDISGELSNLVQSAKIALAGMSATKLAAVGTAVGAGMMVALSSAGLVWSGVGLAEATVDIGTFIRSNIDHLPEDLLRHVCGVVLSINSSPNYYEARGIKISTRLLSDYQKFFGKYVDAGVISMNAGLTAQNIIPVSYFSEMTQAQYDLYSSFDKVLYCKGQDMADIESIGYLYTINQLPSNTKYAFFDSSGRFLTFYDADLDIITASDGNYSWLGYLYAVTPGHSVGWNNYTRTSYGWTYTGDPSLLFNFSGVEVVTGKTIQEAVSVDVDIPLDIDRSGERDIPLALSKPVTITLDDAMQIGAGEKTIDDAVAESVTYTPVIDSSGNVLDTTGWSVLDWLKKLWETLYDACVGIVMLPSKLLDGLKGLFVPSDSNVEAIRDLVDEKLPVVGQLQTWGEDVVEVVGNPKAYASNLTFIVDFSKAKNTKWNYGNSKTNLLDMSWYVDDYKDTVDGIIVGVAWLVFLWNLYGQLPNIISAVGSGTYVSAKTLSPKGNKKKSGGDE